MPCVGRSHESDSIASIEKPSNTVLRRVADGTPGAFAECLDRYGHLVWSLARRACRNRADAEDAAQDIFLAIWHKAARHDPARGSEAAFIVTLAQHLLIDRYRAGRRERMNVALDDTPDLAMPDHFPTASNHVDALRAVAALNRLRPGQKQAIELALWSGLSQQEISRLTGTPLGTVKANMRRGFKALAQSLETIEQTNVVRWSGCTLIERSTC